MASGKALTNSCALLMTWPDGQGLGGGKIQELVTRKFRKKNVDGPFGMDTEHEDICLPCGYLPSSY